MDGNGHNGSVPIDEAAERLGVSRRTVERWVRRLGLGVRHAGERPGRWAASFIAAADLDRLALTLSRATPTTRASDNGGGSATTAHDRSHDSPRQELAGGVSQDVVGGVAGERALIRPQDLAQAVASLQDLAAALREHARAAGQLADEVRATRTSAVSPSRSSRALDRLRVACYAILTAGLVGVLVLVLVAGVRLGTWAQLARWIAGG